MPANVYECMFILDSGKVSGNIETADKQLRAIFEKNNAEVLVSRQWGDDRKFSYPIKKQKKGIYYLTYFSSEGKNLVPIEHDCSLNETILRMLVIKIHPKLVDTMLSLAKGEHAVALHNMQEESGSDESVPDLNMDDRGSRRRRDH
jgi:small subunit ribosomal protein S6